MKLCLACGRVFDESTGLCPADRVELLPYEPTLPPGDVVEGGYRVVRALGVGPCGEVFECAEGSTGRPLVLRLLAPELTAEKIPTELLLRHMQQLREFTHPHVVQVRDVSLHEGRLALVRDWVDGERLADLLAREDQLTVAHAVELALQIGRALDASHKAGLLHLQLRPSNVFLEVGKEGALEQARLIDFGIGPPRLVDGRTVFGTIRTLSPEQIEGRDPTARSDVYALGLLVYRLIAGRSAFAGTGDDVVRQALEASLPPLAAPSGTPVPPALDALLQQMTAKAPAARPRSMAVVVDRLGAIEQDIEDDLPLELAFRETATMRVLPAERPPRREPQTVVIRRVSIVAPAPAAAAGESSDSFVPPLFSPRSSESRRRTAGDEAGPTSASSATTAPPPPPAVPPPPPAVPAAPAVAAPAAPARRPRAGSTLVLPVFAPGPKRPEHAPFRAPEAPLHPSAHSALPPPAGEESAAASQDDSLQTLSPDDAITSGLSVEVVERAEAAAAAAVQDEETAAPQFYEAPAPPVAAPPPAPPAAPPATVPPPAGAVPLPLAPFGMEHGAPPPMPLVPVPLRPRRRRRVGLIVGVLLVAAAVAAVVVWLLLRGSGTAPGRAATAANAPAPADAATVEAAWPAAAAADDARTAIDDGAATREADVAAEPAAQVAADVVVDVAADVAADVTADVPADAPADVAADTGAPEDAAPLPDAAADAEPGAADVEEPAVPEGDAAAAGDETQRTAVHWTDLGFEALDRHELSSARELFARALGLDPHSRRARIGMGRTAYQQGRFDEAVRYLEPVFRSHGNVELGTAYAHVGRTADARQQFERILQRDPGNAEARRALESLH